MTPAVRSGGARHFMRSIARLFGRPPFGPLQEHMRKVRECFEKVPDLFEIVKEGDFERIRDMRKEISQLEWEADEIKNDVRERLPRSIFMPVDRTDLLDVLSAQDAVSDCAEDLAELLTFRPLQYLEGFATEFEEFLDQAMACCRMGADLIEQMDELVEASFGGPEAAKVLDMINELCVEEYKSDRLHRTLMRKLFTLEDQTDPISIMMWCQVFEKLAHLANYSERMANRVRLLLAK